MRCLLVRRLPEIVETGANRQKRFRRLGADQSLCLPPQIVDRIGRGDADRQDQFFSLRAAHLPIEAPDIGDDIRDFAA